MTMVVMTIRHDNIRIRHTVRVSVGDQMHQVGGCHAGVGGCHAGVGGCHADLPSALNRASNSPHARQGEESAARG